MRRRSGQRAQVLTFFALVLPIVLVPIVAYAIDAAAVGTRSAGLQAATAQAAEVAAQQIDAATFRAGDLLRVDQAAARRAAYEVLRAEEPGAVLDDVLLAGTTVTVTALEMVDLPVPWFAKRVTLNARVGARLVSGYDNASSRLPFPTSSF